MSLFNLKSQILFNISGVRLSYSPPFLKDIIAYAIIDNTNEIIKIKKQLNRITSCRRCYRESNNGDPNSIIAAVEIKIIKSFPNNRVGVAAIREFNKNKGKEVVKPGKHTPDDIIPGMI